MHKISIILLAGLLSAGLQAMEPNTAAAPPKPKHAKVPAPAGRPVPPAPVPNTAAAPPATSPLRVSGLGAIPVTQATRDHYRRMSEKWIWEDMYTMGVTRKNMFASSFITLCYDEFDEIDRALKANSQYGLFTSLVKLQDAKSRIAAMAMDDVEDRMGVQGNLVRQGAAPATAGEVLQASLKKLEAEFDALERSRQIYNAEMRIQLKPYLDAREILVAQGMDNAEELDLWSHELAVDENMLCWLIDQVFADDWVGVYRKSQPK